jgi:hypothetical protein
MSDKPFVARSTAIAARVLGDETLVMSAGDSTLFTLDPVATLIWESVDGVTPLEEIVRMKVCAQYDVSLEQALSDAKVLVEQLAGHGLLLLSDRPIEQSPRPQEAKP